jgi:hypothetical protein
MTQDEFITAVHSRKHTLPKLRRKLEALPASERFAVLIRIFADSSRAQDAFGDQEYAGTRGLQGHTGTTGTHGDYRDRQNLPKSALEKTVHACNISPP